MDIFKNASEFRVFRPGETVFREGDPGDFMFVVQKGEVELHKGGRLLATLGEGEMVGEMALLESKPRSVTVVAKSQSQLVPVDQKRFLFLVRNTPYFAIEVMKSMSARLRLMDDRVG
jgi:CRP-like cAMP-binding protein